MAAALRILRAKHTTEVAGSRRRFARLFVTQQRDSSSPLLQRLLQSPLSRFKATLAEFTSDSAEFPSPDLLSSLNASAPQKANLIIEWELEKLKKEDVKEHNRYARLISLCKNIKSPHVAMLVFTSMEEQGIRPTSSSFNALISTSLSSGDSATALSLFEIMSGSESYKPDAETFDALVSSYADTGNKNAAEAWLKAKASSGFPADSRTYGSLVRCCIKSRAFGDARRYFDEMMLDGALPDDSVVNDVLLMYCQVRSSGEVREVLKFVLNSGWEIDRYAMGRVVDLYRELGLVDDLEELVEALEESSQSARVCSLAHCALIRMYSEKDRLDDVEYYVGRMLKHGASFSCEDDVEKVICCYFRREAYDRLGMFLERIKHSYKLTRSAYDLLGAGYRRVGLTEKVNVVVSEMQRAGFV